MTLRRALGVCLAAAVVGCGPKAPPAPEVRSLGGDAARVGEAAIPGSLVRDVARAKGMSPEAALDALVDDALLAGQGRADGLQDGPARWACTAATADLVAQRVAVEGRAVGPPRDDELATVEVVHAVILRSATLAPERGEALAERIRQAVSMATDEASFRARAQDVPHAGAQLTVQRLAPFDASGATADGERMEGSFVAGAFALRARGQTSGVVATPFGWHVIRLIQRTVAPADALEARRVELADAVMGMRARTTLASTLAEARLRVRIETSSAADALMAGAAASTP